MKKILCIDGGGVKGIIPAVVLQELEKQTGRLIHETFDLIVGTSVGAILGGILSTGKTTADSMFDAMWETIPKLFRRRPWPLLPKYSRKEFNRIWESIIGSGFTMAECRTDFMCTAWNVCTHRAHYFKGWEPKDGELRLLDAITRSYAAPLYFGKVIDEARSAVWLDGGVGMDNCPLLEAIIESGRQEWLGNEAVAILSLGCGRATEGAPFADAKLMQTLQEVLYFMAPKDGGLARDESVPRTIEVGESLTRWVPGFRFTRLDAPISREMDKMDGVRYMSEYARIGAQIAVTLRDRAGWLFTN